MTFIDERNKKDYVVPIVSWTATTSTAFVDTTAAVDYDPQTNMIYRCSQPAVQSTTVVVKGVYRRSSTPSTVVAALFNQGNVRQFLVRLKFSPIDPYLEFYAWVEKFEPTLTILDTVVFECTLRADSVFREATIKR
jgi:hypothetical protein